MALEELAAIRAEVVALRGALEKRGAESAPAAPAFRKPGNG